MVRGEPCILVSCRMTSSCLSPSRVFEFVDPSDAQRSVSVTVLGGTPQDFTDVGQSADDSIDSAGRLPRRGRL
ncbi:hypothetical protein BH24ACT15_BH24ACT15_09650 [soil metagenome]